MALNSSSLNETDKNSPAYANPTTMASYLAKKNVKQMGIKFSKPTLTKKELQSVLECMVQDEISFGKVAQNFEKEIANAFEFDKALAVPSLTAAYHLSYMSLEIQAGDEVILPDTAPVAALDALDYMGAVPVLVDLDREKFHPKIETILSKISLKTKSILLYYPFGSFFDYEPLRQALQNGISLLAGDGSSIIRTDKDIKIIEDISYLAGTEYKGRFVGADAEIAIVGLNDDMLITTGKGAALLIDSKKTYALAKDLRFHGNAKNYRPRFDYTMTDYQAAMGLEQLGQLSYILERRRKIGRRYFEAVRASNVSSHYAEAEHDSYGQFAILLNKDLETAQKYFQSLNIEVERTMVPGPLHNLLALNSADFPNCEKLYQKGLLVPIYPNLTTLNVERIIASIKGFY